MADTMLTSSYDGVVADVDYAGNARNLNIWDKKVKEDISNIITDIDPNRAPFLRFLEMLGTKENTMNFQFEWLEEDVKPLSNTIAAGSTMIASAANTTLDVDDSDTYVPGDVLKIFAANGDEEIVLVTAKVTATQYTVERAAADSTATAGIAAADEILKIGSAFAENTNSADPDFTTPIHIWNFVQNFKSSVAISGRFDAHSVRGTNSEVQRQLDARMKHHIEQIELAFLYGNRAQEAGNKTYTGGLQYFLANYAAANNYDANGENFNETWLDREANKIFRYGSSKKMALVSGQTLSKISTFGKTYLRLNDKASTKLGMEVTDYVSAHGTLSLIHDRALEETATTNQQIIIIDPKFVKKRCLEGRDTTLHMNVQANDLDGKKHEILSDIGLEVRLPQAHFIYNNIDNGITP